MEYLLGGQIDFYVDPSMSFAYMLPGRLKMQAVASRKRSALFPDVPTLYEAGVKGVEADTIFGLSALAPVPADIVSWLNREINKSLALPAVKQRFKDLGGETTSMSPVDFKSKIAIETILFGSLIRTQHQGRCLNC